MSVPSGAAVPIMTARDCPSVIGARKCYIRKPGPRSEEPFTSEEWRTLLDRCVRAGRESLLEAIRTTLQGSAGTEPATGATQALESFAEAAIATRAPRSRLPRSCDRAYSRRRCAPLDDHLSKRPVTLAAGKPWR